MRNILKTSLLALPLLMLSGAALAADATGRWKTIDDETGKVKSIVEITQASNGTLQGRVIEVLHSDRNMAARTAGNPSHRKVRAVRIALVA